MCKNLFYSCGIHLFLKYSTVLTTVDWRQRGNILVSVSVSVAVCRISPKGALLQLVFLHAIVAPGTRTSMCPPRHRAM